MKLYNLHKNFDIPKFITHKKRQSFGLRKKNHFTKIKCTKQKLKVNDLVKAILCSSLQIKHLSSIWKPVRALDFY